MSDIGDAIAKLLIDNPRFIPFYLIGLWFLIIKPLMKRSDVESSGDDKEN